MDLPMPLVTMRCNRIQNKAAKQCGPNTAHFKLNFDATLPLTSADELLTEAGLQKMGIHLSVTLSLTAHAVKHTL